MGGAQRQGRAPMTSYKVAKWHNDSHWGRHSGYASTINPKEQVQGTRGLVARQKIPLNLMEIKELSNDEKWDLFDKHVQKHLKF
jgi:hypothetical protein